MTLMRHDTVNKGKRADANLDQTRGRLVVASNRLPSLQPAASEAERRSMEVGGLVTAVRSALLQRGGIWFGWSGHISESNARVRPAISPVETFELAAINLTQQEADLFYNEFSNRTLWPLLHSFPAKMNIDREAYSVYLRTNRRYAEALVSLLREDDLVWVHDYHLLPLGRELRQLGWKGKVGWFLHTPFPPAEVFTILPWSGRFLDMLLDYDLVGLHTRRYANNLFDSLSWELDGSVLGNSVVVGQRSLRVGIYPIGIDPEAFRPVAGQSDNDKNSELIPTDSNHQIILGVDRLDYTKGIPQRLLTFEQLLDRHPDLRGQVSMVQISSPSRREVPEYLEEQHQVDLLVGHINGRFSDADWIPIRYLYRSYPQTELVSFYRLADICLVTPLRDGMNLVAKEFVASQGDDPGVLVLSKFCGAAYTMRDALIVNPYDIEGTSEALYKALTMSRQERQARWEGLMQDVGNNTSRRWCEAFLAELSAL